MKWVIVGVGGYEEGSCWCVCVMKWVVMNGERREKQRTQTDPTIRQSGSTALSTVSMALSTPVFIQAKHHLLQANNHRVEKKQSCYTGSFPRFCYWTLGCGLKGVPSQAVAHNKF